MRIRRYLVCASTERIVSWVGRYAWVLTNQNLNTLLTNQINESPYDGRARLESLQRVLVLVEDGLGVEPLEATFFDPFEY